MQKMLEAQNELTAYANLWNTSTGLTGLNRNGQEVSQIIPSPSPGTISDTP